MMIQAQFEWDATKTAEKLAKHGIGFETASVIVRDPFAVEFCDDRPDYGEDRYVISGLVEQRCLCVAYALRGEAIR
ncbi:MULTISPECIES: BrnT family toxin [Rhodomicrobium]|uniref:BrnT family toxin n=1 Tax=Rhodomicrobium TaxID=1068 RepID=UPI001FDABD09|nr:MULTISPECIES: BrnT family toxin [Rhodomicrobium]